MNPLVILVMLLVATAAGYFGGYHVGENDQKVADQVQFDGINKQLADQKTEAAGILKTKNAENLALMLERDTLKTTLEKNDAINKAATAALRDKYFDVGLRFRPAQAAGRWPGGGSAQRPGPDPASLAAAPFIQLPDPIAADLRRLAFDADTLADAYRKCYGYAEKVR